MIKWIWAVALSLVAMSLQAQADDVLNLVVNHLKEHASSLGLSPEDLHDYELSSQYLSSHSGVEHIYLRQRAYGIAIHGAVLNANIDAEGNVFGLGHRWVKNARQKAAFPRARVSAVEAIARVVDARQGWTRAESNVLPAEVQKNNLQQIADLPVLEATSQRLILQANGLAMEPLRATLCYLPDGEQLILAWKVEIHDNNGQHVWQALVDAQSSELLEWRDLVIHCQFGHAASDCGHEPEQDFLSTTHFSAPNSYHAFPFLVESPNHGSVSILNDPADPIASPFGWHDTNGVAGAEFTITRGNNAHAYQDAFLLERSLHDEPDGGAELCFDFPYQPGVAPYEQTDAAVTNLFVWNNLMHDLLVQYGFDEAAGNFQQTNYWAADSTANDYVRAQALDAGGYNNANFFAPKDGEPGRMQMFIWGSGQSPTGQRFVLEVEQPDSLAGHYGYWPAGFGPLLLPPDSLLVAEVVEVSDTTEQPTLACDSLTNADQLAGRAALIDRGECGFVDKALAAQSAGAVLAIICNTSDFEELYYIPPGFGDDTIRIPVISMSKRECDSLRGGLPGLRLRLPVGIELPNTSGRASDFDNGVIAHEYGHGLSQRLTGGPQEFECLNQVEQAGEGWSDFMTLISSTSSANNADEPRGIATWLDFSDVDAQGIRPAPYSRDMTVNPLTYDDYESVSIPHGIGTIFCSALWDMYWNMVDLHGFDDDIYTGSGGNNMAIQLVVDGMKLQPCSPTFMDSRDAILRADSLLYEGAHRCMIWETFARRGMGFSAEAGGIAAYDVPYTCLPYLHVNKTSSEDVALAGQLLTYTLDIRNGRGDTLYNAVVYDSLPAMTELVAGSATCPTTVNNGVLTIELGDMPGEAIELCSYQLATDENFYSVLDFSNATRRFSDWDRDNPIGDADWRISPGDQYTEDRAFWAVNIDTLSDQLLTYENSWLLDGSRPGLVISHHFDTESGVDGGVIELSTNGGADWQDVGPDRFLENGYSETPLRATGLNPLAGRHAFTGRQDSLMRSAIDLSDFAGQEIMLRARFATDEGGESNTGWTIDQFDFYRDLAVAVNLAEAQTDSIKQQSTVGILLLENPNAAEDALQELGVQLYPNPAGDYFFLTASEVATIEPIELRLLDLNGRLVRQWSFDRVMGRASLSLEGLPAATYLVELRSAKGYGVLRLVKQ